MGHGVSTAGHQEGRKWNYAQLPVGLSQGGGVWLPSEACLLVVQVVQVVLVALMVQVDQGVQADGGKVSSHPLLLLLPNCHIDK